MAFIIEESGILRLAIKRAFRLFDCHTLVGMGIDHGRFYIAMPQYKRVKSRPHTTLPSLFNMRELSQKIRKILGVETD